MRPLFAIAPLAFALAFFSPSPAKLSSSLDVLWTSFGNNNVSAPPNGAK